MISTVVAFSDSTQKIRFFPSACTGYYKTLTCGLRLGPKVILVLEGPVMEGWPMDELMTEKGDASPLIGE